MRRKRQNPMILFIALTHSPAARLFICGSSHFLLFPVDQIDHNSLCRKALSFSSLYLSRGLPSVLETFFSQRSICDSCIELLLMLTYVNPWMAERSPCNCWPCKITCWALEITSIFTMQALRKKNVNRKRRTNTKITEKMPHNTRKNTEVWDAMRENLSYCKRNYACSNHKLNLQWHDGNIKLRWCKVISERDSWPCDSRNRSIRGKAQHLSRKKNSSFPHG